MYQTADYTYLFAPDVPVERKWNFYSSFSYTKGKTSIFEFFKVHTFYKKMKVESGRKN